MAKFAAQDAPPLTFLLWRYAGAVLGLLLLSLVTKAQWPNHWHKWVHAALTGILLHAGYLGAVWYAISQGVPASISALLSALQPIMTISLAPFLLRERVIARQWCGVVLASFGLMSVLYPRLASLELDQLSLALIPLMINFLGMVSLTMGTLYQKSIRYNADLPSIATIQYGAAFIITSPFAMLTETMNVHWTLNSVLTLFWSVFGLSIGAILLFLYLLKQNEAVRSTQLFFLVPPASALQAYLFFGERFSIIQLIGMLLTIGGVALSNLPHFNKTAPSNNSKTNI
jgi:drug/metabolite transporter (DMT)-like permease